MIKCERAKTAPERSPRERRGELREERTLARHAAGRMVLPALRSALRLASGPLQRRLAAMELIPPLEFPCRIEPLPEGCSTIDNSLYNDTQYASSWHSTDRSKELATLDLLNAARIPYFDRVWRRQLDLPPTRPGAFLEVRGRHQHRASACARAPAPAIVPAIEPNAN